MLFRRAVLLVALLLSPGLAQQPPNILLLIGDDIDFTYYGFQGHEFAKTPHLDSLAAEGVVFENGYSTASACRPSTGTLVTGMRAAVW